MLLPLFCTACVTFHTEAGVYPRCCCCCLPGMLLVVLLLLFPHAVDFKHLIQAKKRTRSFLSKSFFSKISKLWKNWKFVSIYGGVLASFVKFSRRKNGDPIHGFIFGTNNGTNDFIKMSRNLYRNRGHFFLPLPKPRELYELVAIYFRVC